MENPEEHYFLVKLSDFEKFEKNSDPYLSSKLREQVLRIEAPAEIARMILSREEIVDKGLAAAGLITTKADEPDLVANAKMMIRSREETRDWFAKVREGIMTDLGETGRLMFGKPVETVTCWKCKASGYALDEFASPYTGLCAKCDRERRDSESEKTVRRPFYSLLDAQEIDQLASDALSIHTTDNPNQCLRALLRIVADMAKRMASKEP